MERLNYLVKKRESYLSLFYKVIGKLSSLNEKIVKEKGWIEEDNIRQKEDIKFAQSKIEEGQRGMVFLNEQTKVNEAQIAQIKAIIEPSFPAKKD